MPKQVSPRRSVQRAGVPRGGFTLIELLVVIGIIAVLMAILVPVIGHVRQSGYVAATRARLLAIQNGIEAYKQRFEAYPGPLADSQLLPITNNPAALGGPFTSSENLVLGLLGGLKIANNQIQFDPTLIGRGPQSLNPLKIQAYDTMVDPVSAGLDTVKAGGAWKKWSDPAHPPLPNQSNYKDTDAPEFVDSFPDAMPILYLRARVGATGVVTDGSKAFPAGILPAYDVRFLNPYTFPALPIPTSANPPWPSPKPTADLYAPEYFGTVADPHVAKQKDGFFLIAAGPDRNFGTADDLTNAGELKQ
jgi:prepilin-type N-terminal cleavage/methylation domain-containing protein